MFHEDGDGISMCMSERLSPDPCLSEDSALVALAQAGDQRAFALLVARCEPMLRAQVARLRLPRTDAEDMAQEGLLALLLAVRTFRAEGGASFRTYAAVCVRNRLLTVLRHLPISEESLPDEGVPDDDAGRLATDPATLLQQREEAEQLLRRLRAILTQKEYEVLLRYLDGCSYEEIAVGMQMSPKAVDNALQRARRKVKARLNIG